MHNVKWFFVNSRHFKQQQQQTRETSLRINGSDNKINEKMLVTVQETFASYVGGTRQNE